MSLLGDWLNGASKTPDTGAVVEDLLTWEEEADALLPCGMTAEQIALIEAQGFVVNLVTGQLIPESQANNYGVPA